MADRVITLKPNADLSALRQKVATDPAFLKALAQDPATELAKHGVTVDPATAKSISDHLKIIPQGQNPAALAVSVVVSAVL
jgi:hypothetical protein